MAHSDAHILEGEEGGLFVTCELVGHFLGRREVIWVDMGFFLAFLLRFIHERSVAEGE